MQQRTGMAMCKERNVLLRFGTSATFVVLFCACFSWFVLGCHWGAGGGILRKVFCLCGPPEHKYIKFTKLAQLDRTGASDLETSTKEAAAIPPELEWWARRC